MSGSASILVVDDDPSLRGLVSDFLAGHGYPFTITAPNRSGLWQAEAKLYAGDSYATWALLVGGEKSPDQWSATAKASLSVAF